MGQSLSSIEAKKPPAVAVIGPFLGYRGPDAIRIVVGLPNRPDVTELVCELRPAVGEPKPLSATPTHPLYRAYSFDFTNLTPDSEHSYRFLVNGEPLPLEGGLSEADCRFHTSPVEWSADDSVIVMSCHNPFMLREGAAEDGWAMWKALGTLIDEEPGVRLLLMGGDQVYNDDIEEAGAMSALSGLSRERAEQATISKEAVEVESEWTRRFIRQYQLFWQDISYRKVLARIPSVAMWDDHDITDGWGSRPESHFFHWIKPEWNEYFRLARDAFTNYQAIRNPAQTIAGVGEAFTFFADCGGTRIYLLDLRSERRSWEKKIWSDSHRDAVFTSWKNIDSSALGNVRNVMILSPVVPFRTNFEGDDRLNWFLKIWFNLIQGYEAQKSQRRILAKRLKLLGALAVASLFLSEFTHFCDVSLRWQLTWFGTFVILTSVTVVATAFYRLAELILQQNELPKLTDDLDDGLTAACNIESFKLMMERICQMKESGRRVVFLSGDIHAAGISEILWKSGDRWHGIPQVVSSPIGYEPMPKAVEGFTTTTSEMVLDKDRPLFARNVFYTSKRNFARIFPERLGVTGALPILFYFEGHRLPLGFSDTFHQ